MAVESRHIIVEFWGGPLDGLHSGWTTDQVVRFPETLVAGYPTDPKKDWPHNGVYHIRLRRDHHYIYQWREVAS